MGPFCRQLEVGDVQQFTFLPTDTGPFWMSSTEQQNRKSDQYTGKKNIYLVRELQVEIHTKMPALLTKDLKNKQKVDIEQLATGLNPPCLLNITK